MMRILVENKTQKLDHQRKLTRFQIKQNDITTQNDTIRHELKGGWWRLPCTVTKDFFCSLHSLLIPKSFKLQPLHQLHFIYLITESAFLMFSGIFQLHCSSLSLSAFTVFFGIFQLFQLIEVLRECKKRFRLHGSHRNTFFREVLYFYPK